MNEFIISNNENNIYLDLFFKIKNFFFESRVRKIQYRYAMCRSSTKPVHGLIYADCHFVGPSMTASGVCKLVLNRPSR